MAVGPPIGNHVQVIDLAELIAAVHRRGHAADTHHGAGL
jgi:hypothetical protein